MAQEFTDKNGIIPKLQSQSHVLIELGCGNNKIASHAVGIDMVDLPGVDIVANAAEGLTFLPDACANEIYASHFIEHIENTELLMGEIFRVLRPGGRFRGAVPHFSNPYYYSDYTHKRFYGLYSFSYFTKRQTFMRKVPGFYNDIDFRVVKLRLVFWSPFKIINVFRKVYTFIFNLSPFMQEMYESSFSNIFPVHEIQFQLEKSA